MPSTTGMGLVKIKVSKNLKVANKPTINPSNETTKLNSSINPTTATATFITLKAIHSTLGSAFCASVVACSKKKRVFLPFSLLLKSSTCAFNPSNPSRMVFSRLLTLIGSPFIANFWAAVEASGTIPQRMM